MEARAIAKNVRIVPRKARLVIDLVRGKSVAEADVILANLNKESARLIRKVLTSATANAENFLQVKTLLILGLGLFAFAISTVGGLLTGKIMCKLTGGKINPLIGSAGVSAVPMAARVAQDEGRKADPSNFLLMHAMGPNVAGVIGSAVAAGVFLSLLG